MHFDDQAYQLDHNQSRNQYHIDPVKKMKHEPLEIDFEAKEVRKIKMKPYQKLFVQDFALFPIKIFPLEGNGWHQSIFALDPY